MTTSHAFTRRLMELIVVQLSNVDWYGLGKGGMNVLRLVCKRLMRVVESCATRLNYQRVNGGPLLP
jgi:hypothetical protein